jgi:hypothetical protein
LGSPERVVSVTTGAAAAIARCHPSSAAVRQASSADVRGRGSVWSPPSGPVGAGREPFCPVVRGGELASRSAVDPFAAGFFSAGRFAAGCFAAGGAEAGRVAADPAAGDDGAAVVVVSVAGDWG